ncbi:dihydrolipoamide acetyltransferase family protein [Halobacteriovorax sp. GFR7]|uniref:dihydrolipoamide acetyltransferase family protein n=1 Tax=unclassified Halobacteriovorax TaxID=2639665 RepID=UPI003D96A5AD
MAVIEFTMPSLGADMDEGKVVSWFIEPGDHIEKGQMVAEIETSKSNIEIESFYTGTVKEILIPEGRMVSVGTAIALFEVAGQEDMKRIHTIKDHTHQRISPRAKKLLKENSFLQNLEQIKAQGPICGDDILNSLEQKQDLDKPSQVQERQKVIAHLMEKSKQTIPHFYLEKEIDVTQALDWMTRANENRSMQERYIPVVIFIKIMAMALEKYGQFNGFYKDDAFVMAKDINIGIVVSLRQGGLVAPAIANPHKRPLNQLMKEFRDLMDRAKAGKLTRAQMSSSTICLTSLGDRGADKVYGVIYPPQVAIVGIGSLRKKIKIIANQVTEVPVCTWTLSADHRLTDGHIGSLLLRKIEALLANPKKWADDE